MKKIYTRILLAALVLLPTCFAILSFVNAKTQPIKTASVLSLELISPDGSSVKLDAEDQKSAEIIQFFVELNNNAHSIEKLPADLEDAACYTARYVSRSNTREYRYYFSPTKPSNSYFEDYEGNAFRIDAADTITFLDSDYSGALYAYAQPPKLSALGVNGSEGKTVMANETEWRYYTYSNVEHTISLQNNERPTLTSSYSDFGLNFDTFPDESSLTITDEEENIIYKGNYADFIGDTHLKNLIREDTLLHFDLTAKWKTNSSLGYGGSAHYSFDLNAVFDPGAIFWLGEETIELGDFVVLSGQYVENLDELTFSSEPSIGYEPKFFADGEYVRALIPISQLLPDGAGDYTFTVTYMGIPQTLSLKVRPTDYASTSKTYNYQGIDTDARNDDSIAELRSFISSLPYEKSAIFSGSFVMNSGEKARAEFGNTVDNAKDEDRFLSNGVAFVAYPATNIYAVNQGKVIAVGTTEYGGNTVVIDHGFGLRSVYYCIKNVNVAVGDIVTTGMIIGTGAGKNGYTDGITAYNELWVGDIPVSYYPLTESGRTGMIVYGEAKE